ncbi:hypothetical protein QUF99_15240 [Bacillus sp. DX4.1]|uniref:XkdX family protein n=1 Tax=Bacillus sp. DX4.1 TaxID=3055867 RepID=UPI0025A1444A|nr:hypothetical protein [Bacillus sp. DX4.1]MDM5188623.1 hypothetical protein [Bacillus sp. DX4.1]
MPSKYYEKWRMFWLCGVTVNQMLRAVRVKYITIAEFEEITSLNFQEELEKDGTVIIDWL